MTNHFPSFWGNWLCLQRGVGGTAPPTPWLAGLTPESFGGMAPSGLAILQLRTSTGRSSWFHVCLVFPFLLSFSFFFFLAVLLWKTKWHYLFLVSLMSVSRAAFVINAASTLSAQTRYKAGSVPSLISTCDHPVPRCLCRGLSSVLLVYPSKNQGGASP